MREFQEIIDSTIDEACGIVSATIERRGDIESMLSEHEKCFNVLPLKNSNIFSVYEEEGAVTIECLVCGNIVDTIYPEMSTEEDSALEVFLKNNENNIMYQHGNEELLVWDDYDLVKQALEEGKRIATIITGESDTAWICKGNHIVNRVGYMVFHVEPIGLEEDIRYW